MQRIYLDNAATSWPKPESVYAAIEKFQRSIGAAAGRGAYHESGEATRLIDQSRNLVANFIGASSPNNVAFTYSGTDSLCTAIMGILRDGDHVVTSTVEHNSVLRPLRFLENQNRVTVSRVGCDTQGRVDVNDIISAIKPDTKLVVLTHVSNVTGAIEPVEAIGAHCRKNGILFLLDAAQSLGHTSIDVSEIGCDILAAPGHKGLLGPLGIGVLYFTDAVAGIMNPFRFGGTGATTSDDSQPESLPEKFEAGNLNVSGIVGVGEGIKFLLSAEGKQRMKLAHNLKAYFLDEVQQISGLALQGPMSVDQRVGVFSMSFAGIDCADAAAALDATWSIQTRAGLHCAPLLHRSLGTENSGGTLRVSLGLFNSHEQIKLTLAALRELASA